MRVLGIDPGLTRCGVGVVDGVPGRPLLLVGVDVIRTPADLELSRRLLRIEQSVDEWVTAYRPDILAVERVFAQHNVQTVMGTAQAATTRTLYDALDRPVEVHSPNAFAPPAGSQAADWRTTYTYDTRGRVRTTTSPDAGAVPGAGTVRFAYDRAGRVRFVQDDNHAATGEGVFTTYDVLGRPLLL